MEKIRCFLSPITQHKEGQSINLREILLVSIPITISISAWTFWKFYSNSKQDYIHKPYPFPSENLNPQDLVYVKQGKKIFSKGIVEHFVKDGKFAGRYKISFVDGTHYHCRPERLIKIEASQTILCVRETNDYRRIAKTQICEQDHVLEIGSDFGFTTNLVSQSTKNVIGIDKSIQQHQVSKKDYPHILFLLMDVLGEKHRFAALPKCNKVFIDINGNRELEAVQECVQLVIETMKPELIVVKSRSYYDFHFGNISQN